MNISIYDFGGYPFIFDLSRTLAERGHQVNHLFTSPTSTKRLSEHEELKGLNVLEIPITEEYTKSKNSFLKRLKIEAQHSLEVTRSLESLDSDVLLCANVPTHILLPLEQWARRRSVRFVPWVQDFYSLAVKSGLQQKFSRPGKWAGTLFEKAEEHIFNRSDAIIPISNAFVDRFDRMSVGREKVTPIPNWAPLEKIQPLPKDNTWSRKRGLHDKFCFVYAGTLGLKHNPSLLYHLADKMQHYPNVRVVILAEGPGADKLQRLQNEKPLANLILEGLQPEDEYPNALASADVLTAVLEPDASQFSVPSKALSYLCAARPILLAIPRDNQAARIVVENALGEISDPRCKETYSAAAGKLFETGGPELSQMGQRARDYAERHFAIEGLANKFENTLLNAVGVGRRKESKQPAA